jgi:hypothetical protein
MPTVVHYIIVAASLLSLFPTEAARPESLKGDVTVVLEPNKYHRTFPKSSIAGRQYEEKSVNTSNADANLSSAGYAEERLASSIGSHLSHTAETATEEQGLIARTRAHDSYMAVTNPSTELISQHHSASASKIHVVAVTNRPNDDRVSVLKRSLLAGGFSIDLFHYINGNEWTWTQRLLIEQKIVQDAAYEDPDAVFLFIDAFDVITLGRPEEILGKFQRIGKGALFSCVTYPYPHQCKGFDWKDDGRCDKVSHWGAECPHWCRFACAGAFMGKAGVLAQIFSENPPGDASDDQCYFNMVLSKRSYDVAIDHRHEVFFSTTDLLQCSLERRNGRLLVTSTGTLPSVIHFDATHPAAERLQSFWMDTIQNRTGPLCMSNSSCTDWCWDWDFDDMTARLTASDRQQFANIFHWNLHWQPISYTFPCAALVTLVVALIAVIIYVRNYSAIEVPELGKILKGTDN